MIFDSHMSAALDRYLTTPPEEQPVFCPICGEECDTIYKDRDGTIFGCENCVTTQDAWGAV